MLFDPTRHYNEQERGSYRDVRANINQAKGTSTIINTPSRILLICFSQPVLSNDEIEGTTVSMDPITIHEILKTHTVE